LMVVYCIRDFLFTHFILHSRNEAQNHRIYPLLAGFLYRFQQQAG